MANLLPPEHKKDIRKAIRGRALLLAGCALGMTGTVLVLAVMPAYIRAATLLESQKAQLALVDKEKAAQEQEEKTQLINLRKRVDALHDIAKKSSLIEGVKVATSERPQGVSILKIIHMQKGEERTLTVSGAAAGRQLSQDFVQRLKATGFFNEVTIPITALTRSEEGSFDIVMKGF